MPHRTQALSHCRLSAFLSDTALLGWECRVRTGGSHRVGAWPPTPAVALSPPGLPLMVVAAEAYGP